MKQVVNILFSCLMLLVACTEIDDRSSQENAPAKPSYNISLSDISKIDFSRMVTPQTKASGTLNKVITPIVQETDTLLYVINYGQKEGWVLAPGDKRLPRILALSETGSFDLESASENIGLMTWLEKQKSYIKYLKAHPDYVPDQTVLLQWDPSLLQTKGGGEDDHEGEWLQLIYTMIGPQTRYYVDHLMDTQWGQGNPWNTCVPFDGNGHRCQTGTGVTALAQLSYYRRKPQTAYAYGTCSNNYNQTSDLQLFNASSSVWNTMALDSLSGTTAGYQAVAALMAGIGASTSIYLPGKTVMSATDGSNYLTSVGISMQLNTFDNDDVLSNILNDDPVLLVMTDNNNDTQYAVIDGIQVLAENTTYYYQWMPIGTFPPVEPEYPDLDHPELYVISVNWGDNVAYFHRINWGFDGLYDNAWYWHGNSYPYWDGLNTPSFAFY